MGKTTASSDLHFKPESSGVPKWSSKIKIITVLGAIH